MSFVPDVMKPRGDYALAFRNAQTALKDSADLEWFVVDNASLGIADPDAIVNPRTVRSNLEKIVTAAKAPYRVVVGTDSDSGAKVCAVGRTK